MLRVVLLTSLLLVALLVVLAGSFGLSYLHRRPNWELVYTGDLKTQRKLASCYEVIGCPDATTYSVVLACAWREIIVEETNRSSPADIAAAKKTCERLSADERRAAEHFEVEIRARLHPQSSKKS